MIYYLLNTNEDRIWEGNVTFIPDWFFSEVANDFFPLIASESLLLTDPMLGRLQPITTGCVVYYGHQDGIDAYYPLEAGEATVTHSGPSASILAFTSLLGVPTTPDQAYFWNHQGGRANANANANANASA